MSGGKRTHRLKSPPLQAGRPPWIRLRAGITPESLSEGRQTWACGGPRKSLLRGRGRWVIFSWKGRQDVVAFVPAANVPAELLTKSSKLRKRGQGRQQLSRGPHAEGRGTLWGLLSKGLAEPAALCPLPAWPRPSWPAAEVTSGMTLASAARASPLRLTELADHPEGVAPGSSAKRNRESAGERG